MSQSRGMADDFESPGQTAFLFDLDGTLIDSVYQHVLAWSEALQEVGLSLSVWKIHRRIGMSGGLFVNALARELGDQLDAETAGSPARPARGGLHPPLRHGQAPARRGRAPADADRARGPLGDRHQRRATLRRAVARAAPAARRHADGHARPGALRQARPRPVPDRGPAGSASTSATAWWSATASGTCWPPSGRERWASGCCRAGTGARSCSTRARFRVYEDPADLLAHLDEVGVRRRL